jgi:hypothetical protein
MSFSASGVAGGRSLICNKLLLYTKKTESLNRLLTNVAISGWSFEGARLQPRHTSF